MPRYRKKPVAIDAVRLPLPDDGLAPAWLADAMDADTVHLFPDGTGRVKTAEGIMAADRGDWLIRGVEGEIYPCKPSIFDATYEPV